MTLQELIKKLDTIPQADKDKFIKMHRINIFTENAKMKYNNVPVVASLPMAAGLTCPYGTNNRSCRKCYALRGNMAMHNRINENDILRLYDKDKKTCTGAYVLNTAHYLIDSADFENQLEKQLEILELIRENPCIRICDSGDTCLQGYWDMITRQARKHSKIIFQGFTANYKSLDGEIPKNIYYMKSAHFDVNGAILANNTNNKICTVIKPCSTVQGYTVPKNARTDENKQTIRDINTAIEHKHIYICDGSCGKCATMKTGCYNTDIKYMCIIEH